MLARCLLLVPAPDSAEAVGVHGCIALRVGHVGVPEYLGHISRGDAFPISQRVHSAAQRVSADSGQYDLGAASASVKCTKDAEARAIKEINLPALTLVAANR